MTGRLGRRLRLTTALMAAGMPALAAPPAGFPEPPQISGGTAELHPRTGLTETYDSNIFLSRGAGGQPVLSSWIHTADLALPIAVAPSDRHRLDLSYNFADRVYSRQPSVNNAVVQRADASYWYEGPRGQTARAWESYLNTVDPSSTELTARLRRWLNTAGLALGYAPSDSRLSFAADAQEARHKYVTDNPAVRPALDRYEQLVGVKAGWQVQPKTVAYSAYHRQLIHYTDQPSPSKDSKGDLVDFGVQGDISAKLTGLAQVGFVYRGYDEAAAPGLDRDTRNFTTLIELAYQPLDRSRVELTASRSLEEATFAANQFYIATGAELAVSHEFPWGLKARLGGGLEWHKYPAAAPSGPGTIDRRDDLYRASAALTYPLREWADVSAAYLYRARFARGFPEFDYQDHMTSVALMAKF